MKMPRPSKARRACGHAAPGGLVALSMAVTTAGTGDAFATVIVAVGGLVVTVMYAARAAVADEAMHDLDDTNRQLWRAIEHCRSGDAFERGVAAAERHRLYAMHRSPHRNRN